MSKITTCDLSCLIIFHSVSNVRYILDSLSKFHVVLFRLILYNHVLFSLSLGSVEGVLLSITLGRGNVVPSLEEVGSEAPGCFLVVSGVPAVVVVSNARTMMVAVRMREVRQPVLAIVPVLCSCDSPPVLVTISSVTLKVPNALGHTAVLPGFLRIVCETPRLNLCLLVRVTTVAVVTELGKLGFLPVLTGSTTGSDVVESGGCVFLASVLVTE